MAPIFNEEGIASYYLPEGTWTNYLTGEKVEGGRWMGEKHDYMSIPLMARQNSIIAVGSNDTKPDYDYAEGVAFHLFELKEGCIASTKVFNTAGEEEMEITAKRISDCIQVEVKGVEKQWRLCLRGINEIKEVLGGTVRYQVHGAEVLPDSKSKSLKIHL